MKKQLSSSSIKDKASRYSAFTLIEMAITLVIISIITGAIIGAQSLIKSSKISGMMSEIEQIKTAINTFKIQYDGNLPGDMRTSRDFWPSTINGDGDGRIEFQSEAGNVFEVLSLAEMIKGEYSRSEQNFVANNSILKSSFGEDVGHLVYTTPTSSLTYLSYRGFYSNDWEKGIIIKIAADRTFYHDKGFINPKDLFKIDQKYDDSSANLGVIRGNSGHDNIGYTDCITETTNPWTATSATYDLSITNENCIMFFFIEREVG